MVKYYLLFEDNFQNLSEQCRYNFILSQRATSKIETSNCDQPVFTEDAITKLIEAPKSTIY